MQLFATTEEMGWFGAGWAVFQGSTLPDDYPPMNDFDAQRAWLDGFAAAWSECPEEAIVASERTGDGLCGRTLGAALAKALGKHPDLLRQFQGHAVVPPLRLH